MLRLATLAFSLSAVLSCGPAATFAARGGKCPARSEDCSFALISDRTAQRYEVVGVIEVEAFSARKVPNDEASFRAAISKAVCRAGGDAVIAGINGDGRYVLATVVKWVDDATDKPVCPKPSPDAATPNGGAKDAGVAKDAAPVGIEAGASEKTSIEAGGV